MNKICTSIEQSKKLIELGIDVNTADMFYNEEQDETYPKDIIDTKYPMVIRERQKHCLEEYGIPAWSLAALLELIMPQSTTLVYVDNAYKMVYDIRPYYITSKFDNPIDAAFEMIVWLKENGKI